jgi:aldose 1-epimerase
MSFKVDHTTINDRAFIHLKNDSGFTATIVPSVGAMLHELIVPVNGERMNLIDSYPSRDISAESATDWFKGVKLSPWPCRIPGGVYKFANKKFQLQKMFRDGTALHGLLFDRPFDLVDEFADDDSASITLKNTYNGDDPGYPFSYECEVTYEITGKNKLKVETSLYNLCNEEIPIADGWHPYFQLGGKVDDWDLYFPAISMLEFDRKLIPTGRFEPYKRFNEAKRIGSINLDNCFFLRIDESKPVCTLRNPVNKVAVQFYTNPGYSYLQLFIPPHRNSIAIENLSGAPNAFNNMMGLVKLQPGNSRNFRVLYQVELEEKL